MNRSKPVNSLLKASMAIVLLGIACGPPPETRTSPPAPSQADLFVSGEGGYHTYRIPALIVTREGSLLAFCEGRKNNRRDHGDIDLLLKRSTDGGRTWSDQQIVYEEGGTEEITIGNPCPVVDQETGTIWLPFCRDNKDVLVTKSIDDGASWSDPVDITADVKKPDWTWVATGPGIGIQLEQEPYKGRLVIPSDHGKGSGEEGDERVQYSHVMYSDDHGETWQLGSAVAPHTDECQVIEKDDGTLLINMRNYWGRQGGRPDRGAMRALATSQDGGATWSELSFAPTLIEPICQASLIRHVGHGATDESPSRLLFSNPASKTARGRPDRPAQLRLGKDLARLKTAEPPAARPIPTWPSSRTDPSAASTSAASRYPTRPSHSRGSRWIGWWGESEILVADRRWETIGGQ